MKIRKIHKQIAIILCLALLYQIAFPLSAYALTGGPSQPEVNSFEPVGTSEMVNLATGDFTYNIPLMDVEGYPINISYHGGVTMDQEASWVGLGWNINPGAVTRGMRGIPDDFDGSKDKVTRDFSVKPNTTVGGELAVSAELFGSELLRADLSMGLGVRYDNYKGVGIDVSYGPSLGLGNTNSAALTSSLNIDISSQNGLELSPSASFDSKIGASLFNTISVGMPGASISETYNSREGLKSRSWGSSLSGALSVGQASASYSAHFGSVYSFGTPTYVPQYTLPMTSNSGTLNCNVGGELYGIEGAIALKGYYSNQQLSTTHAEFDAYGYCNAENANNDPGALHDFNRERDIIYNKNVLRLPVTNQTFDVFSATGQGIAESFRPKRADVGLVYDPQVSNNSAADDGGAEIAFGELIKAGLNLGNSHSQSSSGMWSDGLPGNFFKFKGTADYDDPSFQPYTFESAGDLGRSKNNLYKNLFQEKAFAVTVDDKVANSNADVYHTDYQSIAFDSLLNKKRDVHNENIQALNAIEASRVGYDKKIYSYDPAYWKHSYYYNDNAQAGLRNPISRVDGGVHKAHHISEISITKSDGSKYVYGLPVYNVSQKEATFNVGKNDAAESSMITTYGSGDNTTGNQNGIDHFYSSTQLPPYAHSYLLTQVLSSDYVDIKGDGVTDDDYGTATRINYTLKSGTYNWRTPYGQNTASYDRGLRTRGNDQKASYIYGSKEMWYVHSIESKNYVAIFKISPRHDGFGVADENGARSLSASNTSYKLDTIKLYTKQDLLQKGELGATPIKTVVFEYNYELCANVPNNDGATVYNSFFGTGNINQNHGKLTLKAIYFSYGNTSIKKGQLTPYRFFYADPSHTLSMDSRYNPSYSTNAFDRWGNYKDPAVNENMSNAEFPYADQRAGSANVAAAAWSLSTVVLPSGGVIKVDYESDDYAYVQDRRAMQMCKITDTYYLKPGTTPQFISGGGRLYSPSDGTIYNYLAVHLPQKISSQAQLEAMYLNGITNTFFKASVSLSPRSGFNEYVQGYVNISPRGSRLLNDSTALLPMSSANTNDDNTGTPVNVISKAAWQFTKMNYSDLIFRGDAPDAGTTDAIKGLVDVFIQDVPIMIEGFNKHMLANGYAQSLELNKSFVRLYSPGYKKLGGGCRVKKIALSDSWTTMSPNAYNSEYGQTYDYSISTTDKGVISSGVASYEPMIGNEENPFRLPIPYTITGRSTTTQYLYHEEPYGESFFPAPNVIYSKVKVTNLKPAGKENEITRTGTGYSVYEFYTARDFPIKLTNTTIHSALYNPPAKFAWTYFNSTSRATTSQGYAIEINDMHGKPKAIWQYAEGQPEFGDDNSRVSTALSGVEYIYKTVNNNGHELDNNVTVINSQGVVESQKQMVGVDVDVVADAREAKSETESTEAQINADIMLIGLFPLAIALVWPNTSDQNTMFRSIVTTKLVNRTGILDRVVYHDNGQSTKTVNEAWDKETGNVLLQKTYNEFDDSIYTFTYPAHWMYDGMNSACINESNRIKGITFDAHGAVQDAADNTASATQYIYSGDIVLLTTQADGARYGPYWVYPSHNKYFLIDRDGAIAYNSFKDALVNSKMDLKVIRSGRKNQANAPVGSLVARNQIIDNDNKLSYSNIINASATEFTDQWQTYCCGFTPVTFYTDNQLHALYASKDAVCDVVNPYVKGLWGNFRPKRSYSFIGDRSFSSTHKIREEGLLSNFTPFWQFSDNWSAHKKNWQWSSEVTKFSPFGYPLEDRDTLNRYNSNIYGYDYTLKTAQASNAKYSQIAYDGFEDYGYGKLDSFYHGPLHPDYRFLTYPSHNGIYSPFGFTLNLTEGIYLLKDSAHTGDYCLGMHHGFSIKLAHDLNLVNPAPSSTDTTYKLRQKDCIGIFTPNDTGTYVFSAWVKVAGLDTSTYKRPKVNITLDYSGGQVTYELHPSGDIIEGWQRIDSTFHIGSFARSITAEFVSDPHLNTYFDDWRIHPLNAVMKSFVYDPVTLRLVATLDENNYATTYEYDEEGNLARIKKETVRGIMTVKESRSHIHHNN